MPPLGEVMIAVYPTVATRIRGRKGDLYGQSGSARVGRVYGGGTNTEATEQSAACCSSEGGSNDSPAVVPAQRICSSSRRRRYLGGTIFDGPQYIRLALRRHHRIFRRDVDVWQPDQSARVSDGRGRGLYHHPACSRHPQLAQDAVRGLAHVATD